MDLLQIYQEIDAILDSVNFNALYEGFHKYRFALYNREEIILDGQVLPYREDFIGNTAKEYEGEYIAIWDMSLESACDVQRIAYYVVHEMFHCHQYENKTSGYPSDLDLLMYPDDEAHFTEKYNENRYLADAYEKQDIMLLRQFAKIREERHKKYPAMVCHEWKVEALEGMAEYIGLKALACINPERYEATVKDYLEKLREESNLLFDVRRVSYYVGAVYFLCLERLGIPCNNDWKSELTIYEQNPIKTVEITAELETYEFVSKNHAAFVQHKKDKLNQHMARAEYVACNGFICGYDPMNMFRLEDMIYCSHIVFLNIGGEIKTINSAVALQLVPGSVRDVLGYYV
ncbi:MAG: hypothetical protein E7287_00760 [Lachnospiraceae bacterium]|nr:hypothetical protein [Lachnospiraceae bacterium]